MNFGSQGARVLAAAAFLAAAIASPAAPAAQAQQLSDLPAWAQERHPPARRALVMGLTEYAGRLALRAPAQDAREVRALLTTLGFRFAEPTGPLNRDGILDAVEALAGQTAAGDVVLVYFSGHGLQRRGQNFLVPLQPGTPLENGEDYAYVNLQDVIAPLLERNPGAIYFILDACRSNPFPPTEDQVRARTPDWFEPVVGPGAASATAPSEDRGLAVVSMHQLRRTTVVFAASSGYNAFSYLRGDAPGRSSIYTRALAASFSENSSFNRAFNDASTEIGGWTHGQQSPELRENGAPLLVLRPDDVSRREQERIWIRAVTQALRGDEGAQLREYLRKNSVSDFTRAARRRLEALGEPEDYEPSLIMAETPASAQWGRALSSPTIDAFQQRDIAIVSRNAWLVEPRGPGPTDVFIPDRRLRAVEAGQSVRVLSYDPARDWAEVELNDGFTGVIRNVGLSEPPLIVQQRFVYASPELDAGLRDISGMDALIGPALRANTTIIIRTGLADIEPSGRAEQIAYSRALDLKEVLILRGIGADRILLQTGDGEIGRDEVLVEVRRS